MTVPVGGFQGQTNNTTERAFLDLEAGEPDAQGVARINILGASEYIFVDAVDLAGFVLCIKPLVPVMSAGVLGCNGGIDAAISLNVDHRLGELGVNGFTSLDCAAEEGTFEIPWAACTAGTVGKVCTEDVDCNTSLDATDGVCGHHPAECMGVNVGAVCNSDADCVDGADQGFCGAPHPGVCNGPLIPGSGTGDTGPGELIIVPNPDPDVQLRGLPIELGFEDALPCGNEGPPALRVPFALTTGFARSKILNANNIKGRTLSFEVPPGPDGGENFSCDDWPGSRSGRLVLSAPALDQSAAGNFLDVVTVFTFAPH